MLDWKCRLLVVVVLISIYFSLLDSPLPFSFISSLYPLTPSSLSSTSGTSSWLYPFPPNRPQSRVLLWQNKTKAYIRSSPPLITIHTKHTTQCLTTTGIKKMGNLCFRPESIRKIEIEIEGLRNDIARLDKDRKTWEIKAEGGRTTVSGSSDGRISDQTTAATMRRAVGHHGGLGGHGESIAIEELVPMRWRRGARGGVRVGRGGSCRAA